MISILKKYWVIREDDIPHIGFSFDITLLKHFIRDMIVAWAGGKILLMDFGFDTHQAYLCGAFLALFFSGAFETGQGTNFWAPRPDAHSFFDPGDWLMSVFAGFAVFTLMTWSIDIRLFITLMGIWTMVTCLLYVVNRLLGRDLKTHIILMSNVDDTKRVSITFQQLQKVTRTREEECQKIAGQSEYYYEELTGRLMIYVDSLPLKIQKLL